MNGGNAAAIVLWILIVIIIIIIIVWISCECSKKNKKNVKVIKFGQGKSPNGFPRKTLEEKIEQKSDSRQKSVTRQNWSNMEKPFADSHNGNPENMITYEPYGANGGDNQGGADAYDNNFPTQEDEAARYPKNPGNDSGAGSDSSVCAPYGHSKHGYNLSVNHLMPASWQGGTKACGAESEDTTQWAAYSPSKESFDKYITTAGSARLAVNTRSSSARQIGLPNLIKDAVQGHSGSAPVPIGAEAVLFNDSDLRQTAIYNSVGKYPEMTWC